MKDSKTYKILLVEDEPENREIVKIQLTGNPLFDFEIRECTNGQQAIDVLNEWVPNLIVLDLKMPVMDGHEFMKRFRALNGRYKNTKFIVVSAYADVANHEEASEAGALTFINKPFRRNQILNVIYQALRESTHSVF